MKKIEKRLLKYKLKKNNILLNEEDLDEVIVIYNNLIDFILENSETPTFYRFGFAMIPKKYYEYDDRYYFSIFKSLIEMREKGLLNYLDYALLINCLNDFHYNNKLCKVSEYLSDIVRSYKYKGNDLINGLIRRDPSLIEYVIDNNMDIIQDSKYISDDYKAIMELYYNLYAKYYDFWDEYYQSENIYFEEVIALSYYYFVKNNEFNDDIDHVFSFLNYIYQDLLSAIDKYILVGETESYEQVLAYIDSLYKNSNSKIKIIK